MIDKKEGVLICDICGDSPSEEKSCTIDEIDGVDMCIACQDAID